VAINLGNPVTGKQRKSLKQLTTKWKEKYLKKNIIKRSVSILYCDTRNEIGEIARIYVT
jgi:hypothetical protein